MVVMVSFTSQSPFSASRNADCMAASIGRDELEASSSGVNFGFLESVSRTFFSLLVRVISLRDDIKQALQ